MPAPKDPEKRALWKARKSAATKGVPKSEEHRAKIRAAWTDERRAQLSAAQKGVPKSEEARAAMRESWTDERRQERAEHSRKLMEDPAMREKVAKSARAFNSTPEARASRSRTNAETVRSRWFKPPVPVSSAKAPGLTHVRSKSEAAALAYLTDREDVLSIEYEPEAVPYATPDGERYTVPDFAITTSTGRVIVEVKLAPSRYAAREKRKMSAVREAAETRGEGFELVTERELKPYGDFRRKRYGT